MRRILMESDSNKPPGFSSTYNKEVRRKTMPERKWGEDDLHIHFLPGDNVLLGWSDNVWSPYEKRPDSSNKIIEKRRKITNGY